MGTVHQLIKNGGKQEALNFGVERQEVEAPVTIWLMMKAELAFFTPVGAKPEVVPEIRTAA